MQRIANSIDFSSLMRARDKFENFRKNLNTEQEKAGAIQAFHYCFELSWKTMKRIVENSGRDCYYQKDIFREAAAAHLISDPKIWISFIEMRNITIHTYDEENAEKVIAVFENFSMALDEFINNLLKFVNNES